MLSFWSDLRFLAAKCRLLCGLVFGLKVVTAEPTFDSAFGLAFALGLILTLATYVLCVIFIWLAEGAHPHLLRIQPELARWS